MNKQKIIKWAKIILFVVLLILAYLVADKFIDYIMTVDVITLKRVVNIILVILITGIYLRK